METLREIRVVAATELLHALRSSRVLFLLGLYVAFTLLSGVVVTGCRVGIDSRVAQRTAELKEQGVDAERVREALEETDRQARRQLISTFFSDDEALTEALLKAPLPLLIVFKLSLFFLPLYVGLMAFDVISGEIGPRSIRFLVARGRRSSILFGKYLAMAAVLALLMLGIHVGLLGYGLVAAREGGAGVLVLALGRFWLAALLFSCAYLALTFLCSSLVRQSALSLMSNLFLLFVVWVLAFLGDPPRVADQALFSAVPGVRFASVWFYRDNLLHPHLSQAAIAAGAHLGFAALFLLGAHWVLRRRDL